MSEIQKHTFEGKTKHFEIAVPTMDDNSAIGQVHLQAWLETYPNPDLGIDEAWIRKTMGHVAESEGENNGYDYRTEKIEKAHEDPNLFYRIAKDEDGEVVGFCIASKGDEENHLDALYLLKRAQGQGLGVELMQEAKSWLGDEKPVRLDVVTYNDPAIAFYEQSGFVKQPGTERTDSRFTPMHVVDMVREAA